MPKGASIPDAAPSSPAKQQPAASDEDEEQAPDVAVSAEDLEAVGEMDAQPKTTKRKAFHKSSSSLSSGKKSKTTSHESNEDDRKLPARDTTKRSKKGDGKSSATSSSRSSGARRGGGGGTNSAPPAAARSSSSTTNEPSSATTAKQLLIGKGSEVWNARLQEIFHGKAPKVTSLELLQRAQERLILPPTRFPPRESPLHAIFKPTQTTIPSPAQRGEGQMFACLETCYRDMLEQDVNVEETLRNEYKKLKKGAMQSRVGQIFAEEARLKKQEQVMLARIKGWVSS